MFGASQDYREALVLIWLSSLWLGVGGVYSKAVLKEG